MHTAVVGEVPTWKQSESGSPRPGNAIRQWLLMEEGRQGFLVHPGDSAELHAAALRKLLDDPALRARMGDEGRRTALENYAWPRVAAKLEAYYADLLAGEQPVWASAKSSLGS